MATKILLPNGTIQFAVHGFNGMAAADAMRDINAGDKLTREQIEYIKNNSDEVLRMFDTQALADAYEEGLCEGRDAIYLTTFEQHEQIYGLGVELAPEELTARKVFYSYLIYFDYLTTHNLDNDSKSVSAADVVEFVDKQIEEDEKLELARDIEKRLRKIGYFNL